MKKAFIPLFTACFCCIYLILLLFYSKECISLASNGLLIWYRNMIPSLFPFMVLSGFMIRCGFSVKIGQLLKPILGLLFRLPPPMLYVIFMGFLCGFPMGAKVVADMLEKEQITPEEGTYLLAFCNNIGPLYLLGYVIPLFHYNNTWQILGLMYLVPFLYGIILRYFPFSSFKRKTKKNSLLYAASKETKVQSSPNLLTGFQQALSSSIEQITMLGGCMVFFNSLQIIPNILEEYLSYSLLGQHNSSFLSAILGAFIEIGGGLPQLSSFYTNTNTNTLPPYLPISLLTFGGLSCIMQTCFILKNTSLKISAYLKHKIVQACIYILFLFIF